MADVFSLEAFNKNSGKNGDSFKKQTHPLVQKNLNAWGLYDMHGA